MPLKRVKSCEFDNLKWLDEKRNCLRTNNGKLDYVNTYIGKAFTSIFFKVSKNIMNNRLIKWTDKNDLNFQYGLRKGHSTTDCIF